jgi:hypothetical protein
MFTVKLNDCPGLMKFVRPESKICGAGVREISEVPCSAVTEWKVWLLLTQVMVVPTLTFTSGIAKQAGWQAEPSGELTMSMVICVLCVMSTGWPKAVAGVKAGEGIAVGVAGGRVGVVTMGIGGLVRMMSQRIPPATMRTISTSRKTRREDGRGEDCTTNLSQLYNEFFQEGGEAGDDGRGKPSHYIS